MNLMCQVLGVCRNGYYSFMKREAVKPVDPDWDAKIELVKEIAKDSKYSYGVRRIKKALNVCGYPVTKGQTRKLMVAADVAVRQRKKFKVTTDSNHAKPLYDNVLNREFQLKESDLAYVEDITYIWTQEGWLYLAVVIDLFSRQVVGWSMSSRMTATLVCDALEMAIWRRKPKPGLVVHSDRGSQYASKAYRKLIKKHRFIGSMSRKGNCWDNAVAESFFGSLKQERVQWEHYQTRSEAHQDILDYIAVFYNNNRLHSYLGYLSPVQFEKEMLELKEVA